MEIINLIKCEFIKNFSWKKVIITFLILIIACFGILKIDERANDYKENYMRTSIFPRDSYENSFREAKEEYERNPDFINKNLLEIFEKLSNYYDIIQNGEPWVYDAFSMLESYIESEIVYKNMIENYESQELKKNYQESIDDMTFSENIYNSVKISVYHILQRESDTSIEELKKKYEESKIFTESLINAMKSNLFYKYVLVGCERKAELAAQYSKNEKETVEEYCNYFEKEKIESQYDYRAINATQYSVLRTYVTANNESSNNHGTIYELGNDTDSNRYLKKDLIAAKNARDIVYYAYKNGLKHDLSYSNQNVEHMGYYKTSKTVMNNGLHFGVIIVLIVTLTSAGIVSKEHDKGTIKLLLTKPVKRYKILLSKLIYLIIDAFLIWLVASIIMFFIAGFSYGFEELFTSKIIMSGEVVKETNYLLWYLKEMIVGMIPITFFITLLFSLSTITLSTSVTSGLTSVLTIFSMLIWSLISGSRAYSLAILNYTPLPWISYRMVSSSNIYYLRSISCTPLNDSYGLIISIISTILLFLLTALVYSKKDIKN